MTNANKNTYQGTPVIIEYTEQDGTIVWREMVPIRDRDTWQVLAWVPAEELEEA